MILGEPAFFLRRRSKLHYLQRRPLGWKLESCGKDDRVDERAWQALANIIILLSQKIAHSSLLFLDFVKNLHAWI
jgi:hypothetical protein